MALIEAMMLAESMEHYVGWCLSAHISTTLCNPFWTNVAIISVAIGLLMLAWGTSKLIRSLPAIRAGQKAAPGIEDKTGNSSANQKNIQAEIDEIAARIREEIKRKK